VWVRFLHGKAAMPDAVRLEAKEKRCPLWAYAAPALYSFACALAVRSVLLGNCEAGMAGMLAAVGLLPAFAIPAVFTTRKATLEIARVGALVDGKLVKIDDARLEHGGKGTGILKLTMRSGHVRTFAIASYKDGERAIAFLPPVSAPTGADLARV
jgi:hypothetical protein